MIQFILCLLFIIRSFQALSEDDGSAFLFFDDVRDDTDYEVFMTIGNNLPYEPLMLYDDDKIRTFSFKTPKNLSNLIFKYLIILL